MVLSKLSTVTASIWTAQAGFWTRRLNGVILRLYQSHGPEGRIAHAWPTGSMVLWIAILLGVTLIVNFIS